MRGRARPIQADRKLRHLAATLAAAALGLATASIVVSAATVPAQAASIPQLETQLTGLYQQTDHLVDQWDQEHMALAATRRQIASTLGGLQAAKGRVRGLTAQLDQEAAAAYMTGPATGLSELLGAQSPSDVIERVETLELLAQSDGATINRLSAAQSGLAAQLSQLHADEQAEKAQLARIAAGRATISRKIANTKALVAQLRAAAAAQPPAVATQVNAVIAPRPVAAAAVPARPAAPAAHPKASERAPSQSLSGRAAIAVRFAYAQLGKPYVYGAAGPGAYDCSGLTMASWGAAGVSLPHSATLQYYVGVHVTRAELQPGDLIFSYGLGHVAMYIGNGMQIEAAHTGTNVMIDRMGYEPIVGYTDPAG